MSLQEKNLTHGRKYRLIPAQRRPCEDTGSEPPAKPSQGERPQKEPLLDTFISDL